MAEARRCSPQELVTLSNHPLPLLNLRRAVAGDDAAAAKLERRRIIERTANIAGGDIKASVLFQFITSQKGEFWSSSAFAKLRSVNG